MPLITETYYLSLTQDNRGILRLRCSQDDTLRTVNLKLYNNGSIFVIPSGVSASISGVKQNGVVFSKPCTISQDRESVVLQLSSDITNVDGIIVAEIVLNDGEGGRLGTSNFIIQIEKNPIRTGVVQDTETPIEYINDFIEKIQTLTARLNNLITPSGDASLAEVVDARIGILDSTTYQTLGARLNAEFQRLSNALNGVTILESTGDTTDRTSEILSKLNAYGTCKLGKGDFYVNSLVMPEGSRLTGSGNLTRIILPSSVTNGCVVKPRSNCIIENISFYGGFTGTYSELIASGGSAQRHCIILDRFDSISSENVILNNIFINNFVGSAIIQRYTVGCHCEDIVINMCYAGIDISNASYDGQFTNVSMEDTRFGIVQNGSNFIFNNCVSKDSEYHIMSDQQNTECTFSSCSFSDSSLETTSVLAYLSNVRNGFVFDNCMFDSSLKMGLNACDGIVIKGTNFVGSDTFKIIVSNGRNTLLLITDCIADVEPVVTNAGTAARITSCYLKDGTAWTISEADITVDEELSNESENPIQNKAVASAISEINESLGAINTTTSEDVIALKKAEVTTLNTWTEGKYYITSGLTVNPTMNNDSGIRCMMVAVSEGDALTISAIGGISARAWCFTDASYNVLSVADTGASYENAVINAPDNAAWCFINDRFSDGVCYQSSILVQRVMDTYTKAQTEAFVDDAVTDVAFDVPQPIEWTDGWYITTDGSSVNFKSPTKLATYRTATIPVKAGDKCVIYIQGGNNPRAWCFVDSEYTVISKSANNAVCDGLTLIAPENAAYLILNDMLMSETDSYYLPTLKSVQKNLSKDLAIVGNGAIFAADATAQSVRSAIFGLLTSAAYVSDEDRSGVYDTLRLWSVSTPTKYGERVYHTENLVLDGTNPVHTDLVLQNADRDFTITITVKSNTSNDTSRIFGIAGAVNNVVYGIALNSYKVMCDGAYTALGYSSNAEAPIKVVLRHSAGTDVLKVSHMSTYSKGKYEFELTYTPNPANDFVLSLGATYDNYNKFVGTIHEFSYYSAAWTDEIVDGYMRGTL